MYEFSKQKDGAALIDMGFGRKYWIDTNDPGADFEVALFEESEALEPQPIGVNEEAHGGSLDIEGEIPQWDELEIFVNTDLADLQRRAVQNPEFIHENMALLEDIFGYDVRFHDDEFYVGEGKNEEKRSAIKQIFNIASSHYHVTNTFGIEIMRTTATATIYHLGADEIVGGRFRGLVPLVAGETGAFIGSEMTIGGITHETFHEIDRRFVGRLSVPNYKEPKWGLEWYLREKVDYLGNEGVLGFNFGMILEQDNDHLHLNTDSRASDMRDSREIFPDVAAAVVFGLHEEDIFSKAFVSDPDNRIGFASYGNYVKSLICGLHQYFEHIVNVWFWIIMVLFPMSIRKPYGTGSPPSRHNDRGDPPSNPE